MRYTHVSESAYLDKEGKNYLMLIERSGCKMKYQVVISNELGMLTVKHHSSSKLNILNAYYRIAQLWATENEAIPVPISSLPLENIDENGVFIFPTVIINFWQRVIICLIQDTQDEIYKIKGISFDSVNWYNSNKVLRAFPQKHFAIHYFIVHYLESDNTYKIPYDDFSIEKVEELIAAMNKIVELMQKKLCAGNILNENEYLEKLELLDMQQASIILTHKLTWEMVEAYRNGLVIHDLNLLVEKEQAK